MFNFDTMNLDFKDVISDNLSDFKTIINLLNNNPNIENIKYICESGVKCIESFINNSINQIETPINNINSKVLVDNTFIKDYKLENIRTYNDVITVLPHNEIVLPYPNFVTAKEISINAYSKLINICKVFNQGWIPDLNNPKELKYYPWFYLDDKGGGFRLRDVYYLDSNSFVSAWLCFKTEELAKLSVELFKDIYKEYFEYK